MRVAGHARLLALALAVWLAFFVAGLPDYYQQYSFSSLLAGSIALTVAIAWLG